MAPEDPRIASRDWPDLPFSDWAETCATLHLWMQIVGKVRLAHAPMVNHWWQVALRDVPGANHFTDPLRWPDI